MGSGFSRTSFTGSGFGWTSDAAQAPPVDLQQIIEAVGGLERALESVAAIEQALRASEPIVVSLEADAVITQLMERSDVDATAKLMLGLAQQTFRDRREVGVEVAAEALGLRLLLLQLQGAQGRAEPLKALLTQRREWERVP